MKMKMKMPVWLLRLRGRCLRCGEREVEDYGPFWGEWPHRCEDGEEERNPIQTGINRPILKRITVHSSSGGSHTYHQLPENNPICRARGHLHCRKAPPGEGDYESSTHCFRCGFDNWTDPWT